MNANDVYIVAAVRTPIGNLGGTLSQIKASDLGSIVIKEALKRAEVKGEDVTEVIIGQALTAGQGQNPARQSALKAGLPIEVPAFVLNMLCGSGLKSVTLGYQSIRSGDNKIVVCGGQENMSLAPHVIHIRDGVKLGPGTMVDSMVHDGLTDAMYNIHMGITAENLATEYNVSRSEQDVYAVRSQNLAEAAQKNGYFNKEIVPVEIKDRKGTIIFDKDEFVKAGCTVESFQKVKTCFLDNGTVTPRNASGINDSASAVILMSAEEVQKRSIKPLAKIVAWAQTGICPKVMGIGPVTAVNAVLAKAGWSKDEVDLYELNEAFAAQSLAVLKCLQIDQNKVNIHGGAIALGHPIGASGNRILVTLLYALERTGGKKGVASLCIGGGMGIAIAVERV
ncbi:acetyl-CoA acetyltransferase, cytosolic [Teleopsis dalmanni]|uniref:acetyl-CoA acetyltransferase, cytosolic n=1 Tax=Teleopsis dalmanni TaxID=139649 RepID=UPI0018CFB069|nr:acetyl-CoA acetyltransferase, cytosolic [Teleopsis dalmanni]